MGGPFELEEGPARGPPRPPPLPQRPAFERTDPAYWIEVLGGDAVASRLVGERDIQYAIRDGRYHDLYRLLGKRRAAARSLHEREALAAAIEDRAAFVEPMGPVPGGITVVGCGLRVRVVEDRHAADGNCIMGQYVSLLWLPVVPIGQYLATHRGNGVYEYLGSIPMTRVRRRWRLAGIGAALALLLLGAFLVWHEQTHDTVHFVNALEQQVLVEVGDLRVTVAPGGREVRELEAGTYHLVARLADGRLVEAFDVEVPGNADFVAYNALGAAPLYSQVIAYADERRERASDEDPSSWSTLAGSSWTVQRDADYVFREEPDEIELRRGEQVATRTRVDLLEGNWRAGLAALVDADRGREAAAAARRIAVLFPASTAALDKALEWTERFEDVATKRAFLDQMLVAGPDVLEVHRAHQQHEQQHGSLEALRPAYRAAYEAAPDSAQAGYLYARIAPAEEARAIYERLRSRHADDVWLRRGLSRLHLGAGRFEAAIPLLEGLVVGRFAGAGRFAPLLAQARLGAGKPEEARAGLEAFFREARARGRDGEPELDGATFWDLIMAYAASVRRASVGVRIAAIRRAGGAFFAEDTMPTASLATYLAVTRDGEALATLSEDLDDDARRFGELCLLSRIDVERAVQLALETDDDLLRGLDDAAQVTLAIGCRSAGHLEKAAAIMAGLSPDASAALRSRDLDVLPDVHGLAPRFPPPVRAAVLAGAARMTTDPVRRALLLQEARRFDVFHQVLD